MTETKKVDWKHRAILAEGRLSTARSELDVAVALQLEWQERATYAETALAAVNAAIEKSVRSQLL